MLRTLILLREKTSGGAATLTLDAMPNKGRSDVATETYVRVASDRFYAALNFLRKETLRR
jgi:hypothetical protein